VGRFSGTFLIIRSPVNVHHEKAVTLAVCQITIFSISQMQCLNVVSFVRFRDKQVARFHLKVNFDIEQAMKAQRGSRGIALLFL
jgi:hypothetical protein